MRYLLSLAALCVSALSLANASAPIPAFNRVFTVNCNKTYVVVPKDTCSNIGKAFNITTTNLRKWNPSINSKCTNLYIGQTLCMSPPTTSSSVIAPPQSTSASATTSAATTSAAATTTATSTISTVSKTTSTIVLSKPTDATQCTSDNDCPGVYCCNLFTKMCVLDPLNNICDIQPTTVVTSKTVSNSRTITTQVTSTVTPPPKSTPTHAPGLPGLTLNIENAANFCLFLPSSPGNKDGNNGQIDNDAIADSEKNAVVFCTTPNVNAPGARIFPDGFIKSATYQTNSAAGFVQIIGTMDRDAYSLSSKDGGGQYDNHGAGSPPKSSCSGYSYYVNMIEPNGNDFCIRCCQSYADCNAGRSAYGCNRVVPPL
ncbi:hypothetical protein BDF14DRAFT_286883 [Spinellus fusiger]|nr:hypothetical protein BDF14DRAFT_286883 [Spinellus fusiger]